MAYLPSSNAFDRTGNGKRVDRSLAEVQANMSVIDIPNEIRMKVTICQHFLRGRKSSTVIPLENDLKNEFSNQEPNPKSTLTTNTYESHYSTRIHRYELQLAFPCSDMLSHGNMSSNGSIAG